MAKAQSRSICEPAPRCARKRKRERREAHPSRRVVCQHADLVEHRRRRSHPGGAVPGNRKPQSELRGKQRTRLAPHMSCVCAARKRRRRSPLDRPEVHVRVPERVDCDETVLGSVPNYNVCCFLLPSQEAREREVSGGALSAQRKPSQQRAWKLDRARVRQGEPRRWWRRLPFGSASGQHRGVDTRRGAHRRSLRWPRRGC